MASSNGLSTTALNPFLVRTVASLKACSSPRYASRSRIMECGRSLLPRAFSIIALGMVSGVPLLRSSRVWKIVTSA